MLEAIVAGIVLAVTGFPFWTYTNAKSMIKPVVRLYLSFFGLTAFIGGTMLIGFVAGSLTMYTRLDEVSSQTEGVSIRLFLPDHALWAICLIAFSALYHFALKAFAAAVFDDLPDQDKHDG